MTTRGIICAALLSILVLAGCGTTATPDTQASTTTTTATTEAPSPTQSYSTDKEIASVIAGGEKTWRAAYEKGGECRIAFVLKEDTAIASANRLTCYTNEITAGIDAEIALRDLKPFSIPPSMEALVADTKAALQLVVDADLEKACGPAMTEPKESTECNSALGARSMSYTVLNAVLDKWAPYL